MQLELYVPLINMQMEFHVPLNKGQHSIMIAQVQVSMQTVQMLQHICTLSQMRMHVTKVSSLQVGDGGCL